MELIFSMALEVAAIVYILCKNSNTCNQRCKIIDAIAQYNLEHGCVERVSYDALEPYTKTLFRVFDWGHKHIVDKNILKIIEPYIK